MPALPPQVTETWIRTVAPDLRKDTWSKTQAYAAANRLMVPLHAAFELSSEPWQNEFSDYFTRFMAHTEDLPPATDALSRLQFLYLASRFVALTSEQGKTALIPRELPTFLFREARAQWQELPAWQYEGKPFPRGMRERIQWKLKQKSIRKSYFRAILDQELFLLAIGADLKAYLNASHAPEMRNWSPVLDEMLATAYRILREEGSPQPQGGWLFQPGVWDDHPDFAFSGAPEKRPGMIPRKLRGTAWDSSHSHRFPLWLRSLEEASPPASPERTLFSDLRLAFEKQMFNKVLVPPSAEFRTWRLRNFMDGQNGVYRWGYKGLGPNAGYGPYQVTGILCQGWFAFMETPRTHQMLREVADAYRVDPKVVEFYVGPKPRNRPLRPEEVDPASRINRYRWLVMELGSRL